MSDQEQEMMPRQLSQVAELLKNGQQPNPVSVRELLSWFGAQRRGFYVAQSINDALSELDIITMPDFESAYIDGYVQFRKVSHPLPQDAPFQSGEAETFQVEDVIDASDLVEYVTGATSNPTFQISRLEAANHIPISVKPQAALEEAVMLMTLHDYSQLPVMTSPFEVKGVISWFSIGRALAMKQAVVEVKDCMEAANEVRYEESLFSAISRIVQHGYVLVRDNKRSVSGIITASDLSVQLRQLSEPFLLVGEIENYIRRIIDGGKFTPQELADVRNPADSGRKIENVSDLSFGEYPRLIENESRWSRLGLHVPRASFVNHLNEVRDIRNDVMHFDPDGLTSEQLDKLRNFVRLLQTLQQVGAIK